MNNFESAIEFVLSNECKGDEISENKNDLGGITKYGISLRFLKSLELAKLREYEIFVGDTIDEDDIKNLTVYQAKLLYKGEFWDHAPFEKINNSDARNFTFDCSVNIGISPAIKCAQRSCWSVMRARHVLIDDGILGNDTISLINQCGIYFLPAMRSERAGYYRLVVEHNATQKDNLTGWLNRAYGG